MEEDKVAILMDSLSLISKIESGNIKQSWRRHIDQLQAQIILRYIPDHSGIPFNERADQLAGEAAPVGDLIREPADIMADLKAKAKFRENQRQDEFWSTIRMKERKIKYGDGARVRVRGRDHCLYNQLQMGVLTKSSLRKVIEGGGPELTAGALAPLMTHR